MLTPLLRLAGRIALAGCLFVMSGCGRGCSPEAPPPSPQDEAARQQRAVALLRNAETAELSEKLKLFDQFVALYDDTAVAVRAHQLRCLYLLEADRTDVERALAAVERFIATHKTALDASVRFEAVYNAAVAAVAAGGKPLVERTLTEWAAWLEARDIAGDAPRGLVLMELAKVRGAQGRWKDFDVLASTALSDPELEGRFAVSLGYSLAMCRAEHLGDLRGAAEALVAALMKSGEMKAAGNGFRGIDPAELAATFLDVTGRRVAQFARR